MRFGKRAHAERMLAVEITPMIDVVFLLIIFFMAAARFARETRADMDLPQERGEQQEVAEEAGLIVNIQADGRILVGRDFHDLESLEGVVLAAVARLPGRDASRLKLMIRADRGGDSGRLNQVIARLQRIGVGAARVATEVP